MAYATQDDMVRKFGSDEVVALTDRERTGEINADVLAGALDSASSEIDTYLAARYRLPMATVPRHLVNLCCDIARYNLVGAGARDTEEIQDRYKAARKFLEFAADGKVTLGVDLAGAPVQSSNTVQFNVGTRIFSDRDRGAY